MKTDITIHVYVLTSTKDSSRYTGMTKDLSRRLKEHNAGKHTYTKQHIPWIIIYSEPHASCLEARKREKYLKSAAGRKWLKSYLEEITDN